MRGWFWRLLPAVAFLPGTPALAAPPVVSQYVSGTVGGSSTIDTYGLFGPAGADLSGQKISVFFQYVAARSRFPGFFICRLGCDGYATAPKARPDLAGTALIVVTANAHRYVFAPRLAATLKFTNLYDYDFSISVDPGSPGGAYVDLYYTTGVAFGSPLSPTNPPVNTDLFHSGPLPNAVGFTVAAGAESLTFTVDTSAR